jgi:hypothetical protein
MLLWTSIHGMEVGSTQNYLPIAHNGNKKGHSWPSLGVEEGQEEYLYHYIIHQFLNSDKPSRVRAANYEPLICFT